MSRKALPNVSGPWFCPDRKMLEKGIRESRNSLRRRMILPIHRKQDSKVQRMLNFLQPGTYIRPHLHPRPEAVESICLIQGEIRFFVFDDTGKEIFRTDLKRDSDRTLIDIEPLVWHTFVVTEPDTVLFETKMGPYDAMRDKEFAEWAPSEDDPGAAEWLNMLKES